MTRNPLHPPPAETSSWPRSCTRSPIRCGWRSCASSTAKASATAAPSISKLADLFHLRVLLDAPTDLREKRLVQREGEDYRVDWNRRWDDAEQWYFAEVMPQDSFDLVIPAS